MSQKRLSDKLNDLEIATEQYLDTLEVLEECYNLGKERAWELYKDRLSQVVKPQKSECW